jgi:hypothetical protein
MILDVENFDAIPAKYFEIGNYEDDKNTNIAQKQFKDKVPRDYALCRWAAIEKGIAMMPMSAFYIDDSPYKTDN